MQVRYYMDEHVDLAITRQLRLRGIDVLTAQQDAHVRTPDEVILQRAWELQRIVFTLDDDYVRIASAWNRIQRPFAGVAYAEDPFAPLGRYVHDLEIIAGASEMGEWTNHVEYLPY